MSPAAVEVRSPITSPHSKDTSLQNPHSISHAHPTSPFNFAAFTSASAGAAQCGPAPAFALQRSGSVASGRSRPRLAKVRKQLGPQHGRFRTSSSEVEACFNPFSFSSVSNGAGAPNGDKGDVGFVFRANQSGSRENLDDGERQSGESGVKLGSDEDAKCSIGNGTEIKDGGFVFGTRENVAETKVCSETTQSAVNAKEMVSDDTRIGETVTEPKCENFRDMGFAFGCNWSGLASNSNAEKAECGDFVKKPSCDDSQEIKFDTVGESGKHCTGTFVFGTNLFDLASNLNSANTGSTESVKKPECGGCVEAETRTVCFNSTDSKSTSNLQYVESRGDFLQSGCCGATNVELNAAEFKKRNDYAFAFDASWFDSASNLSAEKRDSGENLGKPVSNVRRKLKVGSKREKVKAAAVKTNANGGCSDKDTGVFIFGSSSKSCDNISSVTSGTSVDQLPDEMNKLNINDSVNVEVAEGTKTSFSNARTASDYKSNEKVVGCANESSETTSSNQSSEGPSIHVKMTTGANSETIDQGRVIFGPGDNAADASGVPISEPFIFRAGLPGNVNVDQCPQFQAINSAQPNVASTASTFSSVGLEFQSSISNAAFVGVEDEDNKFSWSHDELGMPSSFCDPSRLKETLFPETTIKNRSIKGKKLRKPKGKLKKSLGNQGPDSDQVPKESSSKENPDTSGCYSPMDFSPYQEANVSDQDLGKTSSISSHPFHLDRNCPPCSSDATVPSGLEKEDLATAKAEQPSSSNGSGVASGDARVDDSEKQKNSSETSFHFSSTLEDMNQTSFTFSATSNVQGSISEKKRRHKRRSRVKVGDAPFVITPSPNANFGPSSMQSSSLSCPSSLSEAADKSEAGEQCKQGYNSSASETYETCEKWRFRCSLLNTAITFSLIYINVVSIVISLPRCLGDCSMWFMEFHLFQGKQSV